MLYHRRDDDGERRVQTACKIMLSVEEEARKLHVPVPVKTLLLPEDHAMLEKLLRQVPAHALAVRLCMQRNVPITTMTTLISRSRL